MVEIAKAMAAASGWSERKAYMLRRVSRSGRDDLLDAIKGGQISIYRACCILDGKQPADRANRWPNALRRAWDNCTPQQRDEFLHEKLQICSHPIDVNA
jgi:hypothetical protein